VVSHADLRQPYVPRIDCELLLRAFPCTGVMSEGPKVRTAADLSDEELGLLYHFDRTLGRIWESYRLWNERPVINAMVDVPHIYSGWLPESNRDAIWHKLLMKVRGKFLSSLLGHDVVSFLQKTKKPYQTMTLRYDYRVPESLLPADRIIGIGVIVADDAAAAPAPAAVPAPAAAHPPVDPVVDLDADAEDNHRGLSAAEIAREEWIGN
jgi:hypothetical protein